MATIYSSMRMDSLVN